MCLIVILILAACAAPAKTAATTSTAASSGAAAAGSTTATASGPIAVSLKEWSIELSAPTARAGALVFNARNEGKVPHDLVVVRTDLAPNALPTTSGLVDETKVTVVARTDQLTPGDGKRLSVELSRLSPIMKY